MAEKMAEQPKSMPCGYTEKSITDLIKEGWKYEWSFHNRFHDQWNKACDKATELLRDGFWEVALVKGQTELERLDGVAYLYKRKTEKYKDYDKKMGYD